MSTTMPSRTAVIRDRTSPLRAICSIVPIFIPVTVDLGHGRRGSFPPRATWAALG